MKKLFRDMLLCTGFLLSSSSYSMNWLFSAKLPVAPTAPTAQYFAKKKFPLTKKEKAVVADTVNKETLVKFLESRIFFVFKEISAIKEKNDITKENKKALLTAQYLLLRELYAAACEQYAEGNLSSKEFMTLRKGIISIAPTKQALTFTKKQLDVVHRKVQNPVPFNAKEAYVIAKELFTAVSNAPEKTLIKQLFGQSKLEQSPWMDTGISDVASWIKLAEQRSFLSNQIKTAANSYEKMIRTQALKVWEIKFAKDAIEKNLTERKKLEGWFKK